MQVVHATLAVDPEEGAGLEAGTTQPCEGWVWKEDMRAKNHR